MVPGRSLALRAAMTRPVAIRRGVWAATDCELCATDVQRIPENGASKTESQLHGSRVPDPCVRIAISGLQQRVADPRLLQLVWRAVLAKHGQARMPERVQAGVGNARPDLTTFR
jgi:hypothetical protein